MRADPSKCLVVNLIDLVDLAADSVRYGVHALVIVEYPADFAPGCAVGLDRGTTDIFNHHECELAGQAAGLQLLHHAHQGNTHGPAFWFMQPPEQLDPAKGKERRSEEHTSELQSLMRISYAIFCSKQKTIHNSLK